MTAPRGFDSRPCNHTTTMHKTFVLYHSNCPDGFGAAWAAWMHFQEFSPGADVSYLPVNYDQPLPDIPDGSEVFILDFSYPRDVLTELAERCNICVIDHHGTAKDALAGLPYAFFDMSKSGAVLAWEHFFPTRNVPEMLLYLQDRDLWQWTLPRSKEINAGLWRGKPREFSVWRSIEATWFDAIGSKAALIQAGEAIAFSDALNVETLCRHPVLMKILCYTVPVVNTPVLQSEVCHQLLQLHPTAPFAATWMTRSDGQLIFSVRARKDDFDVASLAKEFGGGGHKAAAGFQRAQLFDIIATRPMQHGWRAVLLQAVGSRDAGG